MFMYRIIIHQFILWNRVEHALGKDDSVLMNMQKIRLFIDQ
jgi:hypothetical protein